MADQQPALAQRLLVAEDDDTSFFILKTLLSKQAVQVTRAVDGVDVCEKFMQNPTGFDLILMDIEMPRVNGLEAAQKIRQFELQKDLAPTMIVALTAHDEPEYHRRIFDSRMNSIVQKPVRAPALLEAMRVALESRRF
jgi:CheY-like chemotaxis protein